MDNVASSLIDPIRLIPLAGNLLVGIIKIADTIAHKVEDVRANKSQCTRLSDRIQRVVKHLNNKVFLNKLKSDADPLKQTLERFYLFLQQCYKYISFFVKMWWIKKFLFSGEHKEQFSDLNAELGAYMNEFSMGINIKNYINNQQDAQDRDEDLREIFAAMNDGQKKVKDLFQQQAQRLDEWGERILNRVEQLDVQNDPQAGSKSPLAMKDRNADAGKHDGGLVATPTVEIFTSGTWSLRYSQYGAWHGPFQQQMTFYPSNQTFKGRGENNVGQFTIKGAFSRETNQIKVIQSYKYGTGDPRLNAGHQCQFRLKWNKQRRVFEGINYLPNGQIIMPVGQIEMSLISAT